MNDETLGNLLIKVGKDIKTGKCGLDDDEARTFVKMFLHRKLYITDICREYGMTPKTLENRVRDGLMPKFRKEAGGKKYMYQDEIEEFKEGLKK